MPGCPSEAVDSLTPDRIESLCRGECYHPSSERKRIERIEVVRIRPQETPGEDVGELIEDPWRVFECPDDPYGCTVEFEDSEFVGEQREVRYYVRAIQQASDAINAGGLRCDYDEKGQCIAVNPCYGDYRSDPSDDCLAPNEERAWSSPIYLKFEHSAANTAANQY